MSISWAENEVKLACKRENPDWDGESFDYGCAVYQNALECYKACAPLIDKAGHSGFSYNLFVNVLTNKLIDFNTLIFIEIFFNIFFSNRFSFMIMNNKE